MAIAEHLLIAGGGDEVTLDVQLAGQDPKRRQDRRAGANEAVYTGRDDGRVSATWFGCSLLTGDMSVAGIGVYRRFELV
jgi:hypothetical protein